MRCSLRRRLLAFAAIGVVAAHARGETLAPKAAVAAAPAIGSLLFVPADVYNSAPASANVGNRAIGDAMFAAARSSVAAGEVSLALRHACRALAVDPSHADAARLLGYQRVGDHWAGGYAQQMLKSGHAWHPQFGWVDEDDLARFQQGLRPFAARWISADEDARRHDKIERGWTVRTDHFLVTTNIDRAAGVELATRLESVFQIWQQLFGELVLSPEDLAARLDGKQASGYLRKPFRVLYHRNRQEYNEALRRDQPQIEMTLGIYFDAKRQSHFFAGADQDPGTIAHEAVHQFFYESTPRPTRRLAALANIWAVEGAACYFESLTEVPVAGVAAKRSPQSSAAVADIAAKRSPQSSRAFTIGAPDAGRLPAARHRRVVDDYYMPLAELSALGTIDLQHHPDVARLYSQSAGLAAFFMDYNDGAYRKPFRDLLAAIYAGRDTADKLSQLIGRSYDELDREYLKFMQGLPAAANP